MPYVCVTCGACLTLFIYIYIILYIVQCVLLHSTGKIYMLLMSVGLAQAHSITNQRALQSADHVCWQKPVQYVVQHMCPARSPHLMHM